MSKFEPKDSIALAIIGALILFKLTGHNGSLDVAVAVIIGYYFAHRKNGSDNGV